MPAAGCRVQGEYGAHVLRAQFRVGIGVGEACGGRTSRSTLCERFGMVASEPSAATNGTPRIYSGMSLPNGDVAFTSNSV